MATDRGGGAPFDLFQVDILRKLKDRDWFSLCIGDYYSRVANEWGCSVELSERRLQEACDFWQDDAERTSNFGFSDEPEEQQEADLPPHELDHFKYASILTFWLRRLVPINCSDALIVEGNASDSIYGLTEEQKYFLKYGNELCALLVGFMITLNYDLQVKEESISVGGKEIIRTMRRRLLSDVYLPRRFVFEYPQLLKHKNFSWHALYMVFRSLFEKFDFQF